MVKIRTYKGYKIEYKNEKFTGKNKNFNFKSSTERDVIEQINQHLIKQADEEKELKEQAKKYSELLRAYALVDAEEMAEFVRTINLYTGETTLQFNPKTITAVGMDPANVLMYGRTINAVCKVKDLKIIVNLNDLHTFFKKAKLKGELKLSFEVEREDVKIVVTHTDSDLIFKLPTLDPDNDREQKIPELEFKEKFTIPRTQFYQANHKCDIIGESIIYNSKKRALRFESNSDLSSMSIYIAKSKKEFKSKFSNEYLLKGNTNPYFKKSEMITMELSQDYPLRLEDEKGNWLILAPRVDCD